MSKETNESGFVTQKTDVHSFGVLIWEAENALCQPSDTPLTHLAPYSHVEYNQVFSLTNRLMFLFSSYLGITHLKFKP